MLFRAASPPPDPVIRDLETQLETWQAQVEANRRRLEAPGEESSSSLLQQQIDLQRALMAQMEQNILTLKAKVEFCFSFKFFRIIIKCYLQFS